MTTNNWTKAELKAAVIAYIDMRQKEANKQAFSKKSYYRVLSGNFGRSEKAYEYRMQNISYVYSLMGRTWVTGLRPAKNVGAKVAQRIETLICKIEGKACPPTAGFEAKVNTLRRKGITLKPKGRKNPKKTITKVTQFIRDPAVVAWVLNIADGVCEICGENAPFIKEDGSPFLEVHHLRRLSDEGSDTVTNAVAICPNCHREMHYGENKKSMLQSLYLNNPRLIPE